MQLSTATSTFVAERAAARYSPHTIADYKVTYAKLLQCLGDRNIESINRGELIEFLGAQNGVSAKTLRNYHSNLSALWRWSTERGLCAENIVRQIQPPRAAQRVISPLSRAEFLSLLRAADAGRDAQRDTTILLLLLDTGILQKLAQSGKIRAAMLAGEIVVSQSDVSQHAPREERAEYRQFSHLVGQEITLSEASARYGVSHATISRWVKRGFIRVLRKEGTRPPRLRVYLDEADIAYCCHIYLLNSGQGKWVFNSDGTPYTKK